MTATDTQQSNQFVQAFDAFEAARKGQDPAWLTPIRSAAIARFAELGFPTMRHEEWRYTNVGAIAKTDFAPAAEHARDIDEQTLASALWKDTDAVRLVFVNGVFSAKLSRLDNLPDGLQVTNLADAWQTHGDLLEQHLARHAGYQEHAFVALNTAFVDDGALIHVARGKVIDRPIHVVFATTPGSAPVAAQPRTLLVADEASQCRVVESYVGLGEGTYFNNAVTELIAGENAIVDHYKWQEEGTGAYHIATQQVQQARSSNVRTHALSLGGSLARNNINTVLDGEGADATMNGLYVLRDKQLCDNHLRVEHVAPHCDSRENFKGVLDDRARGVFTGRIVVHKDAQKTDGKQSNMNLLLSEDAQVDTKPQLEIFADDVKCTHGATIGQIDDEALFYLRSRGIPAQAARSLLVYAFASESLDEVRLDALRHHAHRKLAERLPEGALFREIDQA